MRAIPGPAEPLPEGVHRFQAMACDCEVRIETDDLDLVRRLGQVAEHEARRIEAKFSRYRADSVIGRINTSGGRPIAVDDETASLLDYAADCHRLSGGLFDVTSGVLRRVWRFDGSDRVPSAEAVRALKPLIGWRRVRWRRPHITLPAGMEIDFGGLGKEYAVDRALEALRGQSALPALVNFGGDLRVTGPRGDGEGWRVVMDSAGSGDDPAALLVLASGALTTSGDARRFLLKDGVRYSHILDPRTGWPVKDPPSAITVAAPTCLEAGLLSTLAMLQGRQAEAFLEREKIKAWVIR